MKKLAFILLIFISQSAFSDTKNNADQFFNWAEVEYSQYFPSHQNSLIFDGIWYYRFYPSQNIYAAVNLDDNDVYVLGDIFGGLLRIDSLTVLMTSVGLVNSSERGRVTYDKECASCHGINPLNDRDGILKATNPNNTLSAISRNKGGMSYLTYLTETDLQDIADYINSL